MIEHTYITTNGVRLHVAQAGPQDGPLVILLHGFPEFWYGWQQQIPALAQAGFRVWAPDQRGYGLSAKPNGLAAYQIDELAKDVLGLIDAAGEQRAFVVGHDWGAAVTWWLATKYPQRLQQIAILNVPHPLILLRTIRSSLAQLRKSWYIFFFQLPWLPEAALQRNNWRNLAAVLRSAGRPGLFSKDDLAQYRTAWSQPGAITAMLNWYRALLRYPPPRPTDLRIPVPTLLIWGAQDVALGREMAQPSIDLCEQGRLIFIEEAGHWVQHEEAERVNRLLLEFLTH